MNLFIIAEQRNGRVSDNSINRIADDWGLKGNPDVLDFCYDMTTQRELVILNMRTMRFFAGMPGTADRLQDSLTRWRLLAEWFNVRTFCQPDRAIRHMVLCVEAVLDMIDPTEGAWPAFRLLQWDALGMMEGGY